MVNLDEKRLTAQLGKREIFNARSLILTGDTLGLAAAQMLLPLFQEQCGIFMGCRVMPPLELAVYATASSLGTGEPDSPWVLAVSGGGADSCLTQALERAAALGAFTVLAACEPDPLAAKAANRVFTVEPEREAGALLALCAETAGAACRIADVKRRTAPLAFSRWSGAWRGYAGQVEEALSRQERELEGLAAQWSECGAFEAVGDGGCAGAARYAAWEVLKKRGVPTCTYDGEDWCHIPFFRRKPGTIGTLFFGQSGSSAWARERESLEMALKVGRRVGLVTDTDGCGLPGAEVLRLPAPPEGFSWMFAPFATSAVRAVVERVRGGANDF